MIEKGMKRDGGYIKRTVLPKRVTLKNKSCLTWDIDQNGYRGVKNSED